MNSADSVISLVRRNGVYVESAATGENGAFDDGFVTLHQLLAHGLAPLDATVFSIDSATRLATTARWAVIAQAQDRP